MLRHFAQVPRTVSRRVFDPRRGLSAVGSSGTPGGSDNGNVQVDSDGGSHSDFARIRKDVPGTGQDRIQQHLRDAKVVLYMKGHPHAPACGFSWKTVQILGAMNVPFKAHNVLEDDDLRTSIKQFSSWPTIPQLYIGGEFVGGSDIVEGLARSGELKTLLDKAGVYDAEQGQNCVPPS